MDATTTVDTERYLERIGVSGPVDVTLAGLTRLQQAHLSTVPFENLHVAGRLGVRTDLEWSLAKVVDQRRGGWCFEVNGAFSALLESLGFTVRRLGAAVLLDGPNSLVDHLTLEVALERPYLVDVGFGDSFATPLVLNSGEPQAAVTGTFQFMASEQGTTLTRLDGEERPVPQYRFKRVTHQLADFDEASRRLQNDPDLHWRNKPFATRLIDGGPERVTLLKDRLRFVGGLADRDEPIDPDDWEDVLQKWFALDSPA